jgi:thiol-disulfide isomerase/thioredoxin
MQKKEVSMVKEDEAVMEKKEVATKETSMMKSGSYEAYDMTKLTKAETGDVVLFFRASWCPTCRGLDKDIRANLGNIPENLTILDVDYDNSNELKKKYGVTYQHTMVQVDKDGNMIKKWMGSPNLTSFIKEVI